MKIIWGPGDDTTCTDCNDITTFKVIEKKTELIYSTEVFYHSRKIKDDNEIKIVAHTANILDKSVSAVRQRIKRKDKPMPQGKVWKQEAKGYEIFINLKNYRKYM